MKTTHSKVESHEGVRCARGLRVVAAAALAFCLAGEGAPRVARAYNMPDLPAVQKGRPAGDASSELSEGRALLHRGSAGDALVHLEKALALYRGSGDRGGEAGAQDLLGELYEREGRYDVALDHFKSSLQLFGSLTSEKDEKKKEKRADAYNFNLTLSKIGEMFYRLGNLEGARSAFEQMRVAKPNTGALGKAKRLGGLLGGISVGSSSDNRDVEIGAPAAGAALTAKQELDFYRGSILYAGLELGLGRVDYSAGQLDSAQKHFENVLSVTKGDLPLLGKLGQTRRYRAAARTSLGDVALRQGRYEDALKLFDEAADGAEKDKRLDLVWPARRGVGRADWLLAAQERDAKKAKRLRDSSLEAYRASLESIETLLQGSVRADESRSTFLTTTRDVFDETVAVLAETALASAPNVGTPLDGTARQYAAEAFQVSERGRARSLLEMLGESGATITEGVPADLLRKKQENLDRQQEVERLLTGVRLSDDDDGDSAEKLEKEADRLHVEYESIENRIRSASPRYAELTAPQPLSLDEVRAQVLDADTALLEYSVGGEHSYLWAVTAEGVTLARLPARDRIDRQVVALRDQILPAGARRAIIVTPATESSESDAQRGLRLAGGGTFGNTGAFVAASHALYETAVAPAAQFVGKRRLLVVPDGSLSYVPFETFLTSTAGTGYAALSYLVKSNEIVYAPSASVVAALRRQSASRPAAARSVLVVADPVFDAADARLHVSQPGRPPDHASAGLSRAVEDVANIRLDSLSGAGAKFRRLAGTRYEAQQIDRSAREAGLKTDVWLDLDASEANATTRDLSQYRVLHFATHGLIDTERPQFTGLVLSLVGNREGTDGFLRTDQVFNLKLGSPLVMLSACETGLGREARGEGIIGLTRAFMYAGAPTVGVSLWSVADQSTAQLMSDFYKGLLGGRGSAPSAAMRSARLSMIASEKYSAPFFWAPFVLVGDWRW